SDRGRVAALEVLEAFGLQASGRSRVDHAAAADGRLRAEHEPVAAGGHNRLLEAQLGKPAGADDPSLDVCRPEMDLHRRRHGLELLEHDVEAVADWVVAGLDERVSAAKLAPLDRRQVHGDALPGLRLLDRLIVNLDAPNPNRPAVRLQPQEVASGDRARPERPRDDRADAAQ